MFDQVCLLSEGRTMYMGPAGDVCNEHFRLAGSPVPKNFNPADHFLDVISVDYRTEARQTQTETTVNALYDYYMAHGVPKGGRGNKVVDETKHSPMPTDVVAGHTTMVAGVTSVEEEDADAGPGHVITVTVTTADDDTTNNKKKNAEASKEEEDEPSTVGTTSHVPPSAHHVVVAKDTTSTTTMHDADDYSDNDTASMLKMARESQKDRGSFCEALWLLTKRSWREQTRDKFTLCLKYSMNTFFILLFGLVYFQLKMDQTSLQNRTGILFFMAMNQAFGAAINISQVIPLQIKVVTRERASNLYAGITYYLATFIVVLPLEMIPQFVYGAILYSMVNLRPGFTYLLTYVGLVLLENMTAIALGMVLSVSFNSVEMAGQLAPAFVIVFLIFSGYFLNEGSIPVWIDWFKYLSFIRYTFQALSVNEFKDQEFECPTPASSTNSSLAMQMPCLDGNQWLEQLGFEEVTVALNCLWNGLILIGFHVLAMIILFFKKPKFLTPKKKKKAD